MDRVLHIMPLDGNAKTWLPTSMSNCGKSYSQLALDNTAFVTANINDYNDPEICRECREFQDREDRAVR